MKANRFLTLMAMLLLAVVTAFAQAKDEVTLTVTGDGATKEEATKVALRSAIEQAYGTFVSANTQILNDELVKDEIVTISSGNVKSYQQLSHYSSNGKEYVTLQATVSISKLVSYAQSKGASTEFAGATFAMNLKIKELNKKNEAKALGDLLVLIGKILPSCYELKFEMGEPYVFEYDPNYIGIKFKIHHVPNKTAAIVDSIIHNTLDNLTLSEQEQAYYKTANLGIYEVWVKKGGNVNSFEKKWWFRNEAPTVDFFFGMLVELQTAMKYNYVITDNLGEKSYLEPSWQYEYFDSGTHHQHVSLLEYLLSCEQNRQNLQSQRYTFNFYGKCHIPLEERALDDIKFYKLNYFKTEKRELYNADWSNGGIRYEQHKNRGGYWGTKFLKDEIISECLLLIPKDDINKYTNFEVTHLTTSFGIVNLGLLQ